MIDSQVLALLDAALRGTLIALLLLLAGVLWRDRPPSPFRRIAIALALGLCVQAIASAPLLEAAWALAARAPLIAISVGNGVLFWLFVRSLVDDEFVPRRRHLAIWLAVMALACFNMAVVVGSGWRATNGLIGVQRAVPLFFAVLTALTASLNWRADLVERRRWLRGFVIVTGVGYALAMVVMRSRSPHGELSLLAATLDVAFMLFIVAVIASQLLRLNEHDLFLPHATVAGAPAAGPADPPASASMATQPAQSPALAPPDPAEQRLAEALQRAMADERAYRTEDLTVAALAAKLAVPEYRLRRLINQRLGHRNFNAFVNGFRLAEVRAALVDPGKRDLPILTIALDAGFGSIGPFNRAFKAATGMTPGDYRRVRSVQAPTQKKLADS